MPVNASGKAGRGKSVSSRILTLQRLRTSAGPMHLRPPILRLIAGEKDVQPLQWQQHQIFADLFGQEGDRVRRRGDLLGEKADRSKPIATRVNRCPDGSMRPLRMRLVLPHKVKKQKTRQTRRSLITLPKGSVIGRGVRKISTFASKSRRVRVFLSTALTV